MGRGEQQRASSSPLLFGPRRKVTDPWLAKQGSREGRQAVEHMLRKAGWNELVALFDRYSSADLDETPNLKQVIDNTAEQIINGEWSDEACSDILQLADNKLKAGESGPALAPMVSASLHSLCFEWNKADQSLPLIRELALAGKEGNPISQAANAIVAEVGQREKYPTIEVLPWQQRFARLLTEIDGQEGPQAEALRAAIAQGRAGLEARVAETEHRRREQISAADHDF